jgi:hypothetical protein
VYFVSFVVTQSLLRSVFFLATHDFLWFSRCTPDSVMVLTARAVAGTRTELIRGFQEPAAHHPVNFENSFACGLDLLPSVILDPLPVHPSSLTRRTAATEQAALPLPRPSAFSAV